MKRAGAAIDARFGFDCPDPTIVKRFDVRMLVTEKRDLLEGVERDVWKEGAGSGTMSTEGFEPFESRIVPHAHPDQAAEHWLRLYRFLTRED